MGVILDWVKKGWGLKLSQTPSRSIPYVMDFSVVDENDLPPLTAAVNSVRRIADKYPAPFTLMVSGGVDSQAMVCAWMKSGVPFKLMSVQYVTDDGEVLNVEDLETLKTFVDMNGLAVEFKDFKIIDFIERELESYVLTHSCTSPQICTHMKMSELVTEGTVIFSGNCYSEGPNVNYTILGLLRYATNTQRSIIPFFFIHDPELVGSFRRFFRTARCSSTGYANKCDLYSRAGFDVIPQKFKMTGFERVKEIYDEKSELVTQRDRLEFGKYPSKRVFDILHRYRFTRQVKYVDNVISLHPKVLETRT
jgi:hypothetical protein